MSRIPRQLTSLLPSLLLLALALTLTLTLTLTLALPAVALAETVDWTQFRGRDRNGISLEKGLLRTFPESGPAEIWRRSAGPSFSGFVSSDGRLYTTESDDDGDLAIAIDPATGETLWSRRIAPRYQQSFGDGPGRPRRSTASCCMCSPGTATSRLSSDGTASRSGRGTCAPNTSSSCPAGASRRRR